MDDKVKALLERVKDTAVAVSEVAGSTARYAGKYAGQMVDVAKLNMQIFDLKTEINELLQAVGQVVYDTHLGVEAESDTITTLLAALDDKNQTIDELKTRIAVLKNCKSCPACGTDCGQEDKFCKNCGAAL